MGKVGGKGPGGQRTISPFLGYIMMINMCLGTGFLGVPYSFFYAGYLAAVPTLLFVAFLSWLNCSWLLEVMARAQVFHYKTKIMDKVGGKGPGEQRTISPFLGYIMMINMCLGTGFLGVPYSFFYAGYLAAVPTLLLVAFLSWLNCSWLLEVMARAQAVESLKNNTDDSDEDARISSGEKILSTNIPEHHQIDFRITMERKFEMVELCEIFGAKWLKYVYLIVLSLICFVGMWAFSTVAGSAWSSNIPFNFAGMTVCDDEAFHHRLLPVHDGGCLNSYYFSLFLFGVIVVTLSLLHLKELAVVQLFMGLLRFVTVGAIIIYSIVRTAQGGDGCVADYVPPIYSSNDTFSFYNLTNATKIMPYEEMIVKFDGKGWLGTISVFSYAFIIHFGVASLTHPVKNKKYMQWMVLGMFVTALALYMSLGIVAPLWFKANVQETVTLNFIGVSKPGNHLGLRILAYYLIFFPSLDVMSAYPLVVHCLVNNIYIIITGRDTSKPGKWRFDWLLRIFLRLIGSVTPILAAMGMANLIYIINYGGLTGYIVCYFFPAILQLASVRKCKKEFAWASHKNFQRNRADKSGAPNVPPSKPEADQGRYISSEDETTPLLQNRRLLPRDQSYMTPYSIPVLSHPLFVTCMTVILVAMFVMIVVSIFVRPAQMHCVN